MCHFGEMEAGGGGSKYDLRVPNGFGRWVCLASNRQGGGHNNMSLLTRKQIKMDTLVFEIGQDARDALRKYL
jgi:hypothetical protein